MTGQPHFPPKGALSASSGGPNSRGFRGWSPIQFSGPHRDAPDSARATTTFSGNSGKTEGWKTLRDQCSTHFSESSPLSPSSEFLPWFGCGHGRAGFIRGRLSSLILAVVLASLIPVRPAHAQVAQPDLDAVAAKFADKKYAEAAAACERLIAKLGPDQSHLAPTLNFNRGCAQLAAGDQAEAEKTFLDVDSTATDPALRAAARYNLAQIACKQAEDLAQKEPAAAIEHYRRAERHFRNALAHQPAGADAARNIDIVQRRIAKLLEDQEKQQQQQRQQQDQQNKQDHKDQDKQNPDQQNKDQQKQDQDKQGRQQPDQQKQDQKDGQPNNQDRQAQDPKDQQGQQNKQQQQQQQDKDGRQDQQPSQSQDKKDKQPAEDTEGKGERGGQGEPKDQPSADAHQQQPQAGKPQDHRQFDLTAAQILDKEKKQRERLRQLLQIMRARAAPVEKDW